MSNDNNQSSSIVLVPIEQRLIDFYGDKIVAVLVQKENIYQIYVPLRPLCDYLGLDWSAQYRRIKRHPVLKKKLNSVAMTTTELSGVGRGERELICLQLEYIAGWLFGIDSSRVRPELEPVIIRYQDGIFLAIWREFQAEMFMTATNASVPTRKQAPDVNTHNPTAIGELEQIRLSALAVVRLAEQQIEIVTRLDDHESRLVAQETRLEQAARFVGGLQRRMANVEEAIAPESQITNNQAEQIKARVQTLAEYLMRIDPKRKIPYGAIFAELYRRFGVSDYHHIQRSQFDQVMQFLNEWREAAGAGRVPDQLAMFDEDK